MTAKLVWEHSLLLNSIWRQARREMLEEDSSGRSHWHGDDIYVIGRSGCRCFVETQRVYQPRHLNQISLTSSASGSSESTTKYQPRFAPAMQAWLGQIISFWPISSGRICSFGPSQVKLPCSWLIRPTIHPVFEPSGS